MPALDGIRGLAVLAVLFFHGGVLTGGYLGVDAFFVLSGFLITSLVISEVHRRGRLDLRGFWARRARRLLPALFLALFGVALYAAVFATPNELERIRDDAFATLLYVANWRAISAGHGYWDLFQAPSPLEHAWSLAIEEQFYLVWPLVVVALTALASRRARRGGRTRKIAPMLFGVALVAGIASALWCMVLFDPAGTSRAYLGTDTRIAAILFGAAFAAWIAWRGPIRSRAGRIVLEAVAIAAVAALGFAWAGLDGQDPFLYRGGLLLCGIGVLVVVAAASHPSGGPVARVLSWRPLVAIGIISYGLYLWHWPVYVVMSPARMGIDSDALLAIRIATSIGVAIGSYFLVERPIRYGSVSRRRLAVAAPVAAVACVATILVATSGAVDADRGPLATATRGAPRVHPGTQIGPDTSPQRRLLVAGDSVGGNLATAAQALQAEFRIQVGDATSPGCVLPGVTAARTTINLRTQEISFNPCAPTWLEGNRLLVPGRILLVYGTAAGFTDLQLNGNWYGACDAGYQAWYQRTIRELIGQMEPSATVFLALVPPIEGTWIPSYANQRIDCINAAHRKLDRELDNVETIDLASMVCPGGVCRQDINGGPFRIDGFHYSRPAAEYLARQLITQILAVPEGALAPGAPESPPEAN
jgi:peptidoglycan/LPS O-acetylase OafA/YrhL